MATSEQVAEVRRNTDEESVDSRWDDPIVQTLIDSHGVFGASATIWRQKAADYAKLVNVSEAGSSRNMGDLHKNAIEMVKMYSDLAAAEATGSTGSEGRVQIKDIVRDYRE